MTENITARAFSAILASQFLLSMSFCSMYHRTVDLHNQLKKENFDIKATVIDFLESHSCYPAHFLTSLRWLQNVF